MLLNIRLKMYRPCMSVAGRVADAECREDEFIGIGGKDEIPGVAAQRNQERIRLLCFAPVVRTIARTIIDRSVGISLLLSY